jgi:hypothetical protein
MPLKKALLRLAPEDRSSVAAADLDRTAGIVTILGCFATLLAALLPWMEKAALAVSLTTVAISDEGVLLAILALISAGIAAAVLLRRPASAALAILLIALALVQVALAIWVSVTIMHASGQAVSNQPLISAIGTGAYLGVFGSLVTLVGGTLAWTKRRRA